ncbi:hypothetical protein QBC43DRAFT_315805 [Cladorrhinum sp. PSN259]|nr:hypothetical protein QBC43DRAFT_315805 [Cladorrhinum sp. PSN259]
MSSFRASFPSGQMLRLSVFTLQANTTLCLYQPQAFKIQQHYRRPLQARCYAKLRMMRMEPLHKTSGADLMFKKEDVPSLDLLKEYADRYGPGDITREDMHKAAEIFCSVARSGSSTWKPRLLMDFGIDNYTLHYAAAPLLAGPPGRLWLLGLHMMATASSLSYQPSTMSLMRLFLYMGRPDKMLNQSILKLISSVEAQFKQLARTEKSPDILTLQGLLAQREGKDDAALKFFNEAIDLGQQNAGNPPQHDIRTMLDVISRHVSNDTKCENHLIRQPRWTFEGVCWQRRGVILLKKGLKDEACRSFLINAAELDLPSGFAELGKLCTNDSGFFEKILVMEKQAMLLTRQFWLTKAAQAGDREAGRLLAREFLIELEEADESPLSSPSQVHQAKYDATTIQFIWGWIKIVGQSEEGEDFVKRLQMIDRAVRKGQASMRLEGVNKDGTLKVAIWIYNGQANPQKTVLDI